jgi:hypothetical protein
MWIRQNGHFCVCEVSQLFQHPCGNIGEPPTISHPFINHRITNLDIIRSLAAKLACSQTITCDQFERLDIGRLKPFSDKNFLF